MMQDFRKPLISAGLALLALYTGWQFLSDPPPIQAPESRRLHAPDFWFDQMTLTNMNAEGLPKSRIHATRMTHFRDDDTSDIVDLHFESYKDNRPPIIIASPAARVNADGDIIRTLGATHIQRDAYDARSWLKIDTHEMWFFSEENYAQTDYLAVIRTADLIKRGVGLEAWTEEDHFKLHAEVRNRHERNRPPTTAIDLAPADRVGDDAVLDQPGPVDG